MGEVLADSGSAGEEVLDARLDGGGSSDITELSADALSGGENRVEAPVVTVPLRPQTARGVLERNPGSGQEELQPGVLGEFPEPMG